MTRVNWNFDNVTKRDWIEAAKGELKGKPLKELIHTDEHGVLVEPYYDSSDLLDKIKGATSSLKLREGTPSNFYSVTLTDPATANEAIHAGLQLGADSISIFIDNFEEISLEKALEGIQTEILNWEFQSGNGLDAIAKWITKDKFSFQGVMLNDPPGLETLGSLIEWSGKNPAQYPLTIAVPDNADYAKSNAMAVARLIEIVDKLTESGLAVESILSKLRFSFSFGLDFFGDAARVRAITLLLDSILPAYKLETAPSIILHCIASNWNNETLGPHESILKATTNITSGLIGGCNSFQVMPEDSNKAMDRRLAWHTYNVLSNEAHLDKVFDPGRGSYYFEDLTSQIAEKSLDLLKDIEANGGYSKISKES